MIGKKFGMVTVIELSHKKQMFHSNGTRNGNRIFIRYICDCGSYGVGNAAQIRDGHTTSCGCQRGNLKYSRNESVARKIFNDVYSDGDISFEQFYTNLSQQNCFWCDSKPNNFTPFYSGRGNKRKKTVDGFKYNGLDRIDHSKPHTLDNVITSCAVCNFMRTDMSFDEFLKTIKRIYINLKKSKRL